LDFKMYGTAVNNPVKNQECMPWLNFRALTPWTGTVNYLGLAEKVKKPNKLMVKQG